jgi:hypothetical protein
MTEIIRIFDSGQNATEAANELKANHFSNVRVAAAPAANGQRAGDATSTMTSAGFSTREAEAYAGTLKSGGAVLSVEAPFGRGGLAEQILDRHGPSKPVRSVGGVDSGSSFKRSTESGYGDDPAPFSSLFGLRVLSDPKPTTVSSLGDQSPTFTWGLLSSDFYVSSLIGLPLLTNPTARASLIDNPAPLSSLLGLPVLLRASRDTEQNERRSERQVDHQPKPPQSTELRSRVG